MLYSKQQLLRLLESVFKVFNKGLNSVCIALIGFYQLAISPLFPSCCRYTPSCSEYAIIAFRKYGPFKGFILTFKRILRCRPKGGRGWDPVP